MKPRTEAHVGDHLSPLGDMPVLANENGFVRLCFDFQKDDANAVDASRILAKEPFEKPKSFQTF